MRLSLEMKALGWAVLAASLSLGGAGLLAGPIKIMADSRRGETTISSTEAATPEIATTPEMVSQGHEFFEMSCSQCHGDDAHGDEGPDLHSLTIPNSRIATTIRKGIKGEMPTFAKKYNDQQIAAIVSYLRTLK